MRIYSYVKKQTSQSGKPDLISLLPDSSFSFPLLLSFSLPALYLFFSLLSHLPCKRYDIQSTHKILTGQPSQRLLGVCIIEVSAFSLCGPENLILKLSDRVWQCLNLHKYILTPLEMPSSKLIILSMQLESCVFQIGNS